MVSTLVFVAALLSAGPDERAKPPAAAAATASDPALLAEYNALHAKVANTADAHWKLGLWCEQKGLKPEAQAEFLAVTQLDPTRDAAWKKLGLVKHNGQWKAPEQVAAERTEAEAQRKADAHWRPLLQKWKGALAQKDRRSEAENALAEVNDPRAVPSVWKVFANGNPADQERAIDILGHIEGERSTRALAGMAIFGKTEIVRQAAIATVARRDRDEVVVNWIMLLHEPVKYEVRPVAGPGSAGVLVVEGERFNVRRFYSPPSVDQTESLFVDSGALSPSYTLGLQLNSTPPGPPAGSRCVGQIGSTKLYIYDYHWAPPPPPPKAAPDPPVRYQGAERAYFQAQANRDYEFDEASKMAAGAQAQLEHDIGVVESANASTRELNARLGDALRRVSGKDLGASREAWLKWWMTHRGYSYTPPKAQPKATVDVQVPLPYVPQAGPPAVGQVSGGDGTGWCMLWEHGVTVTKNSRGEWIHRGQCFVAGTAVLTPDGTRTIESLQVGDRVLTGDGPDRCGRVVAVHRSSVPRTLRLVVGGESIVTTEGHPFWKVGSGWVKAGDLSLGDQVRSRNGAVPVEAIDLREGATVWNLSVAEGSSFYVGRLGVLVHDVSPIVGTAQVATRDR